MLAAAAYLRDARSFGLAAVFAAIIILAGDLAIAVLVLALSVFISHGYTPSLKERTSSTGDD